MPNGKVRKVTIYNVWQTIQVVDQFGQPLDSVYAKQSVFEGEGPFTSSYINQDLRADGTYLDPVGSNVRVANNPLLNENDAMAIAAWKAAPLLPPVQIKRSAETSVSIEGGYPLDPAVKNRSMIVTPVTKETARVQIVWP